MRIALFLATALLSSTQSAMAQFVDVPYQFLSNVQTSRVFFDKTHLQDDVWDIGLNAASNGYGTWTTDGHTAYLIANELGQLDASLPNEFVPSGLVASRAFLEGEFADVEFHKTASNVNGSVFFVRPVLIGPQDCFRAWRVESLHDKQILGSGNIPSAQIEISGAGYPKPLATRDVLTGQFPFRYPDVFLTVPLRNDLGLAALSSVVPEKWDVSCDANFLYIVWEQERPDEENAIIWSTTIDIRTGVATTPALVGYGRGPTVACDVRRAPALGTFDVAAVSLPGHLQYASVWTRLCENGQWRNLLGVGRQRVNRCETVTEPYHSVDRARILVGSVAGQPTPAKAVYILSHDYASGIGINNPRKDLLFQKIAYDALTGQNSVIEPTRYVDGVQTLSHPAPFPPGSHHVIDADIVAFANPYDGQAGYEYAEFHCAYPVAEGDYYDVGRAGLFIVRSDHNGCWGSLDSRVMVNKNWTNNHWEFANYLYVTHTASANQMGLHLLWRDQQGNVNYNRSMRRLDEDIEENTLLTGECKLGDGTSHGGTVGATLLPGKTLTMWTEPVEGVSLTTTGTNSGVYINNDDQTDSWHNARLFIEGQDVNFHIGTHNGAGSRFVMLPNAEVHFDNEDHAQVLSLNQRSEWDFYGRPNRFVHSAQNLSGTIFPGPTSTSFFGSGNILLNGQGSTSGLGEHDPPENLLYEPVLRIHGGATFTTSDKVRFVSEEAHISVEYEPSVVPVYGDQNVPNASETGQMIFHGRAEIYNSHVFTHLPEEPANDPGSVERTWLTVRPCMTNDDCTPVADQFLAVNSLFKNDGAGFGKIATVKTPSTTPFGKFVVDGGHFLGNQIAAAAVENHFEVRYAYFADYFTSAVFAQPGLTSVGADPYDWVHIHHNSFGPHADGSIGIHLKNFSDRNTLEDVVVSNNEFRTDSPADPLEIGDNTGTAIFLDRTTGAVLRNEVETSRGYHKGIVVVGGALNRSRAFLCDNFIKNVYGLGSATLTGAGLETTHWDGIAKLNRVSYADVGHASLYEDIGTILFSRYSNCYGPGLKIAGQSKLDLSGIHDLVNDYAAYDTVDHNANNSSLPLTFDADIVVGANLNVFGTSSSSGFATYGQNTFVTDQAAFMMRTSGTTTAIGGINENYWGRGAGWTSLTDILLAGTTDASMFGITYDVNPIVAVEPVGIPFSVSCGGGFNTLISEGSGSESLVAATPTECEYLRDRGNRNRQSGAWARAVDTLRLFVERCPNESASASEISSLTGAVQSLAQQMQDPSIYLTHREWLKSVMYLNVTDPLYYCAVANGILGTFAALDDINGAIAVFDYLIQSGKCTEGTEFYIKDRNELRKLQVEMWQDSVTNPQLTPLDTTKKTLEDLDLEILRGHSTVARDLNSKLDWLAVPNPFLDQVSVRLNAPHGGFVRIELFDALGRSVSEKIERQIDKGATSFTFPTDDLESGSYLLRVEFDGWQVSTQRVEKR